MQPNHAPMPGDSAVFMQQLAGVSYEFIAPLREDVRAFLRAQETDAAYMDMLTFTVTEILTNLIRHPAKKPSFIDISITARGRRVTLDVSDDSTPFSDFAAKRDTAIMRLRAHDSMAEGGYGLGCILQQHEYVAYIPMAESEDGLNHFIVRDRLSPSAAARGTLFLVDDDPVALNLQKRMLEDHYTVIAFPRARQALEAFDNMAPDLVVSDLSMPDMDGIALRTALAERPRGNETPFIFLSGHHENRDNPYINALGIDDFLCKPVERDHLLSVVARLLRRSGQIRGAVQEQVNAGLSAMLRPSLPAAWKEWRMAVRHAAAEAGGGDFILHRENENDGAFTAILADVMGHGRMAKFFAYAYAGYLRSLFHARGEPGLAGFFERLSACVAGDPFLESIIMTCQGIRLDAGGCMEIVSAGHPPPLLVRAGACQPVEVAGPLPGLAEDYRYTAHRLHLAPGDRVLFATDGFFHAFDADETRRERLMPLLDSLSALPGAALAERAWAEFTNRAEPHAAGDDATLIIMEYGG